MWRPIKKVNKKGINAGHTLHSHTQFQLLPDAAIN